MNEMDINNPPPKGTPLRHKFTGVIYYSTGTTNKLDRLYCDSSPEATNQEFMLPLEVLEITTTPLAILLIDEKQLITFLKQNLRINVESDSHGGPHTEHELQIFIKDELICSTYLPSN